MRLLVLALDFPLPPNNGSRMRNWAILRSLAQQGNQIHLLSFANHQPSEELMQQMYRVCPVIDLVLTKSKSLTSRRHFWLRLKELFSHKPFAIQRYHSLEMQERLSSNIHKSKPDFIVCDTIFSAVNVPQSLGPLLVVNTQNVEHQLVLRYAGLTHNPLKRAYARLEANKLKQFERSIAARCTALWACSVEDATAFRKFSDTLEIAVVPNVVDFRASVQAREPNANIMLYQGGMDWFPNRDAVEYFATQIFPLILKRAPSAQFIVAGRNPSPDLIARYKGVGGIRFTGTVEDMQPLIDSATVCVVPLRIGGGTRLKILEAGAAGKAIVSTTLGAEGLTFCDGQEILIADSAELFAKHVCRLLTDEELRRKLGRAAYNRVRAEYGLDAMGRAIQSSFGRLNQRCVAVEN